MPAFTKLSKYLTWPMQQCKKALKFRQIPFRLRKGFLVEEIFYCPNEAAALGNIVVSLTCPAYLWGSLIAFSFFMQRGNAAKAQSWVLLRYLKAF